ncbi:hypothetical protein ACLB1T_29560 [Escherichia coli]
MYFGAVGWPDTVPDHISLWGSLLKFRREFDQFVNLRPVSSLSWRSLPAGADAGNDCVVRENTKANIPGCRR